MSEARVLVLDADPVRASRTAELLDFIDYVPQVLADVGSLSLERHAPRDWAAVVLGSIPDPATWQRFLDWLKRDPLHPPVLGMPEHHDDGARQFGLNSAQFWPLDYPIKYPLLSELLRRASIKRLDEEARVVSILGGPTGHAPGIQRLRVLIAQVAPFDTTVLILGESGSGKEVAARAIHDASSRRGKPFVAMNCGAIPGELLESELFGHEKGSFTGAAGQRIGRFELANTGTLFLDEIGDLPPSVQVKLLRVLQERRIERIGGTKPIELDVRVIAATHQTLEKLVAEGKFREDLFYRLNVIRIDLPPLRERAEDIPLLVEHFCRKYDRAGRTPMQVAPETMQMLLKCEWPGNVRQLENAIERGCATAREGVIQPAHLPPDVLGKRIGKHPMQVDLTRPMAEQLGELTRAFEERYLRRALRRTRGHVGKCAKITGLSRRSITEKISLYKIDKADFKQE